jgi:hypothetical protein
MEVIFRFGDREWCYDFDSAIPAVGDRVELWYLQADGDLDFVFATIMDRTWILPPGSDCSEPANVVMRVEPCEEIPDGAIEDSEVWPANEEQDDADENE